MKNSIPTFLSSPERFIQIEGTFFTLATFCYSAFRGNLVITNGSFDIGYDNNNTERNYFGLLQDVRFFSPPLEDR